MTQQDKNLKHRNAKTKILGVFCHCDDEVLFGWPIFQSDEYEKHLMICCSDAERNRPNRKRALEEVCKQENINLIYCLDEPNDFYALPTRRADYLLTDSVRNIETWLSSAITKIKPDYIMTHSVVGEYGHGSHRLLFEICSQHSKVNNVIITDICEKSNHRSHDEIPISVRLAYYNNVCEEHSLDIGFYKRCKAIYDKHNAWTWCYEPVEKCYTYTIPDIV